jgi:hypothetical protein
VKAALKWEDISSYSRGEVRVPKAFEAKAGAVRLRVYRRDSGLWVLWGIDLFEEPAPAGVYSAVDAQAACEEHLRTELARVLRALDDPARRFARGSTS